MMKCAECVMKALLDSQMRISTRAPDRLIHEENFRFSSGFLCDDADFADFTDAIVVVVVVDCLFVQKLIY